MRTITVLVANDFCDNFSRHGKLHDAFCTEQTIMSSLYAKRVSGRSIAHQIGQSESVVRRYLKNLANLELRSTGRPKSCLNEF